MDVSHITSPYFAEAVAYAQEIAEGRVLANRARKLACQRFLNDLQRDDLDFKDGQFDLAIKLIEGTIHHVRGEDRAGVSYKGRPMILAPWQKFVIVNLFGFFKKGTNIRRYTEALIFLPRKQGKSLLFCQQINWMPFILRMINLEQKYFQLAQMTTKDCLLQRLLLPRHPPKQKI